MTVTLIMPVRDSLQEMATRHASGADAQRVAKPAFADTLYDDNVERLGDSLTGDDSPRRR